MYDIQNENGTFYNRESVIEIAKKLDLIYPHEEMMTIKEAIEYVKTRPQSWLNSDYKLEGLVLRSPIELYGNNGGRVICKIKVKDFVDGIKDYKE
jgi:hypothetical protein